MVLKIGLTGGIGSGKTTVARLFAELDIPVIDADDIAHRLVEKGQPALELITLEFSASVLNADGTLNRSLLRQLVFSDRQKKQRLESILHPLVYQAIQADIEKLHSVYCIICVPLLLETGMSALVDRILVVDCPVEIQIERVLNRDRLPLGTIEAIIANQISRAVRIAKADDLIDNAGTDSGLAEQVKKLHNLYLSLSTPGLTRL